MTTVSYMKCFGLGLLVMLTACAPRTFPTQPNLGPFLQERVIEGKYPSTEAVMLDPASTTRDLALFCRAAEDTVKQSNNDKVSAKRVLKESEK
jgi:hypothetical protein